MWNQKSYISLFNQKEETEIERDRDRERGVGKKDNHFYVFLMKTRNKDQS